MQLQLAKKLRVFIQTLCILYAKAWMEAHWASNDQGWKGFKIQESDNIEKHKWLTSIPGKKKGDTTFIKKSAHKPNNPIQGY